MKLRKVNYFQEGGVMAPEAAGAAPEAAPAGGDPMQDLLAGAQLALQSQDCQIALQVCQMLMQLAGGGAEGGAPAGAPEGGAPMARNGAKLVKRINNEPVFAKR